MESVKSIAKALGLDDEETEWFEEWPDRHADRMATELWMLEDFVRREWPQVTTEQIDALLQFTLDKVHRDSGRELVKRQEQEKADKKADAVEFFSQWIREPGEGSTWHRLLIKAETGFKPEDDHITACGRRLDPATTEWGKVGDDHVLRFLLCRSCKRLPDDLTRMAYERDTKRRRKQ